MKFTVFGSSGFIGSNLLKYLETKDFEVFFPNIRKQNVFDDSLGHVIYAIGVPNFLEEPFNTVDGHVCILKKILEKGKFESLLYLSSSRIYYGANITGEEEPIRVNPSKLNDLYNISKIMGESICMTAKCDNVRIVRPSNVTGNNFNSNLFLPSIIRDAIEKNKIILHTTLESEKDYILVNDLISILPEISLNAKQKIYNVARGQNTKTEEIVDEISRITGCEVEVEQNAKNYSFPIISTQRIKNEFNFNPKSIIPELEKIISNYKKFRN